MSESINRELLAACEAAAEAIDKTDDGMACIDGYSTIWRAREQLQRIFKDLSTAIANAKSAEAAR